MKYYTRLVKKYMRGDIVFCENSDCDGMYIVDKGRVRIYKTVGVGRNKREVDLCTLGPKTMFGEMAMIDESKRSASVQAIEPTQCTIITKKIFEDQLSHIPPWMVNMIKILVSRLRETNEKLRTIVEEHTSVKVDGMEKDLLTLDAEKKRPDAEPAAEAEADAGPAGTGGAKEHYRSEEIINSLFKK